MTATVNPTGFAYPSVDIERLFMSLAKSTFRSRFRLKGKDVSYLAAKGLDGMIDHARGFLEARLFPAHPANDGHQTPMRGHPVFVAQHATATCCRKCLAKWHGIAMGHPLTQVEQERVLGIIRLWLAKQIEEAGPICPETSTAQQGQLGLMDWQEQARA